jgi:hypothetical protein
MAMEKIVKKEPEAFDPWKTPRETWLNIMIPDEDPTGLKFPSIGLNKIEFQAGQSYTVPAAIATFVNERVKAYNKSVTRLFSPTRDYAAERAVSVGTTAGVAPSGDRPGFVDASRISTMQ